MHWITIILIGIAANLDNLGIGLAYGVKQVKIPILSNAVIAVMSMIVTYIAVTAGSTVVAYISPHTANLLGSLLLCIIGLWTLMSNNFSKQQIAGNPELFDEDKNLVISTREAMALGFVLSANCLAGALLLGQTAFRPFGRSYRLVCFRLLQWEWGVNVALYYQKRILVSIQLRSQDGC